VFLCLVAKISDWFLEQQINIKFFVKLGKNASYTCALHSEAFGGWKSHVFLIGINGSKRIARMCKMMKYVAIQDFTETVKMLEKSYWCANKFRQRNSYVHRKSHEFWANNWILHYDNALVHKALSVKQFMAQKSITEMEHPPYSPDGSKWLLALSKNKVCHIGMKISRYWRH
jgi:hypothetical protein